MQQESAVYYDDAGKDIRGRTSGKEHQGRNIGDEYEDRT